MYVRGRKEHVGCGFRSLSQLYRWFTASEIYRMQLLGYRIVWLWVDRIAAESPDQVVFVRRRPLSEGAEHTA